MGDCVDRDVLERFLRGALSESASERVAVHVERCSNCEDFLGRLAGEESDLSHFAPSRDLIEPDLEPSPAVLDRLCRGLSKATPPPDVLARRSAGRTGSRSADNSRERRGCDFAFPAPAAIPGYEILAEVSHGGMGVVYKARQVNLNRLVALKMILAGARAGSEARARFHTEAEAVARLHHPNIIQIYDIGEYGGCLYFSMELVEGPTLDRACNGRPQPARLAAEMVETLARAIACAHQQGILHRDLKPANVLLQPVTGRAGWAEEPANGPSGAMISSISTSRWTLKLADFGLAKRLDDVRVTRQGVILGTPCYMAPEQAGGKQRTLSPAVDIYSLGAILYELLTGRPPFVAGSIESTLALVASDDPIPPRRLRNEVPRDLETICLKCLEKEPSRRYADADELASDLGRFLAGEPIQARPPTSVERLMRLARRNRGIATALAVIAVLLVVSSIGSLLAAAHFRRMEDRQRRLAARNGTLAQENEVQRRKAEEARDEARTSQRAAELMLADMATEHGLQAAEVGRDREAVLWFAAAARAAATDPMRRRANTVRARAWSRRLSQPIAVLQHPAGVPLTLAFHPGNQHLISTPAPYPGVTVVWDIVNERPLALPGNQTALTAAAWSPRGDRLAIGTRTGVTVSGFPDGARKRRFATDSAPTLLTFSADGHRLAVATGKIVRIWDERQGAFLPGNFEHAALVLTIEFTPDGRRLVTSAEDAKFRVFALSADKVSLELVGAHQQAEERWTIHAPRLDAKGARLISVTASTELTWWDLGTRAPVRSLAVGKGWISYVATNRDRTLLGVTTNDLGAVLLDLATGKTVAGLKRGPWTMLFSSFRPDGRALLVGGSHPEAQYWELPNGRWLGAAAAESTGFRAAAFSNDGRLLSTAGYDDRSRGERARPAISIPSKHQVVVWALPQPDPRDFSVATGGAAARGTFSSDSRLLLARLRGRSARVYRIDGKLPGGPLLQPPGDLIDATLVPDGRTVVTAAAIDGAGRVDLWDWSTGRRQCPTVDLPGQPLSLASSPSGRIAVLGRDGLVCLLDGSSGRVIQKCGCGATEAPAEDVGVTLGRDGRTVLVAIHQAVQAWDADTGKPRFDPLPHAGMLSAALSGDGRLIASAGADSALRIWSTATGRALGPAVIHPSWLDGGIDFHPDSRHVLTICKDMVLRVWDTTTGRLAAPPLRPASNAAARFSPDGRVVVTAGAEGTVDVWDWRTGQRLLPPRRLDLTLDWAFTGKRSVQFSPDGRFVAIGGRPQLHILSLAELEPTEEESIEELTASAELLSQYRVQKNGTLNRLTSEEWLHLWQSRLHSNTRTPMTGSSRVPRDVEPRVDVR